MFYYLNLITSNLTSCRIINHYLQETVIRLYGFKTFYYTTLQIKYFLKRFIEFKKGYFLE